MEYTLGKRYKLDKVKNDQFKNAYNVYAIEEYKIIHEQKKMSATEKAERLKKANDIFCEKVRPLFKDGLYRKWRGKRMYDFIQNNKKY